MFLLSIGFTPPNSSQHHGKKWKTSREQRVNSVGVTSWPRTLDKHACAGNFWVAKKITNHRIYLFHQVNFFGQWGNFFFFLCRFWFSLYSMILLWLFRWFFDGGRVSGPGGLDWSSRSCLHWFNTGLFSTYHFRFWLRLWDYFWPTFNRISYRTASPSRCRD